MGHRVASEVSRCWRAWLRTGSLVVVASVLTASACGGDDEGPDQGNGGGGKAGAGTSGNTPGGSGGKGGSAGSSGKAGMSGSSSGAGGAETEVGGQSTGGQIGLPEGGSSGQGLAGEPSLGGVDAGGAGGAGTSDAACDGSDPAACVEAVTGSASDFGNPFKSAWFLMGCMVKAVHDCWVIDQTQFNCPNPTPVDPEDKGAITLETYPIGGTPGQNYKVSFTFNAIASPKAYAGGSRDAGATPAPPDPDSALHDSFYRDGAPVPSNYPVWKLMVFDEAGQPARHFYMNSFPDQSMETHRGLRLSYSKSIVVVGGGSVKLRIQVPVCLAPDNCGPNINAGPSCPSPQGIPNEPAVTLPTQYQDPYSQTLVPLASLNPVHASTTQPWHTQLGHLTVTAVEETNMPVSHNFF